MQKNSKKKKKKLAKRTSPRKNKDPEKNINAYVKDVGFNVLRSVEHVPDTTSKLGQLEGLLGLLVEEHVVREAELFFFFFFLQKKKKKKKRTKKNQPSARRK
jgi:hypothetical protein